MPASRLPEQTMLNAEYMWFCESQLASFHYIPKKVWEKFFRETRTNTDINTRDCGGPCNLDSSLVIQMMMIQ